MSPPASKPTTKTHHQLIGHRVHAPQGMKGSALVVAAHHNPRIEGSIWLSIVIATAAGPFYTAMPASKAKEVIN